jgi:hypothetical protein
VIKMLPAGAILDPRFVVTIEGKEFVTYQGLLDVAHQHCGLTRIETEILQYPTAENGNAAVVRAVAEGKDGELYADIGDANPSNCTGKVARHLMRMASTRAKARALRDFTNVGMTAIEELCDDSEAVGGDANTKPLAVIHAEQATATPVPSPKPPKTRQKAPPSRATLSEAQTRAIDNLCRRRDIAEDQLQEMAMEQFGVQVEELNPEQAGNFIRLLQQAA